MKVHLFKIEQFFSEPQVLEAELKYPLTSVQTQKVKRNSITYNVMENTVELSLDASNEYLTGIQCSCDKFSKEKACIHVIMAAWEFRKSGLPASSKKGRSSKKFQISTLISHIPERDLKQFISGYAQKNNEFRQLIKLMFSHELESFISFEDVKEQLVRVFDLYKSKLDIKKYQRKLEFYIRTFLGVAEDLLMQKDYRTALFYNLAAWEVWIDHLFYCKKLNQQDEIYGLMLKIFKRIENSEISPELYKFMIKAMKDKMGGSEFVPILEFDVPETLMEWNQWDETSYNSFIMKKFLSGNSPEEWLTRVLLLVEDLDTEMKEKVRKRLRKIGRDAVLRKVTHHYATLSPKNYLFLRRSFQIISKEQLRALESQLPSGYAFLIHLDLLIQYREISLLEEILYEHQYSKEHKGLLISFIADQTIPPWIEYLVDKHILKKEMILKDLKDIDEPKDWVQLLPHLNAEHQKDVISMIRNYCMQYAQGHLGLRAKKHLQSIGQLLEQKGFGKTWDSIKVDLLDKFSHRRTFQSMDKHFS